MKTMYPVQIIADEFTAGLELDEYGVCKKAAPIIRKHVIHRNINEIQEWARDRGFKISFGKSND